MYNKGLKITNKKVKEKNDKIAQKVVKGILIHWYWARYQRKSAFLNIFLDG